jgi:hypothetical protein
MPTNVYLTTSANTPVDLVLRTIGPDHGLDDHYHLLTQQVPSSATDVKVMSVDRGGHLHAGDAVDVGELQLWVAGVFVAALQVMLDNQQNPIMDTIHWSWRVPTPTECRWDSSYDALPIEYGTSAADVHFTVQGRKTVGFDDIYLNLRAQVKGYSSLAADRHRQASSVLAFATLMDGTGMVAGAPMLDEGPAAPIWKPMEARAEGTARFVGSASVLTSFTTSTAYIAALTDHDQVWIGTTQGKTVASLTLKPPTGVVKALAFSNIWQAPQLAVDVFATAETSDGKRRLYHRLLGLEPFRFHSDWDDWDATVALPAYCPSSDYRYLFMASPGGIIRGAGVYYTYAAWGSTSWSSWTGLEGLPNGAVTSALTAFPWYSDDKPQAQVGVICTATDRTVYFFTFDQSPPKWTKGASGVTGPVAVAASTNSSPMAAHGPTSMLGGFNWIKEHAFSLTEVVPDSRAFGNVALVVPFKVPGATHAALVRESDNGFWPTAVGVGGP